VFRGGALGADLASRCLGRLLRHAPPAEAEMSGLVRACFRDPLSQTLLLLTMAIEQITIFVN
jgi:hypothetical protein